MFKKILGILFVTTLLAIMFLLAPYTAEGDENPSKVGKNREIHLMNLYDQDRWITVYDGQVMEDSDSVLTTIDISETYGSPQFFAYSCCIGDISDAPGIWIDYKTQIDPDDTTSYDTKFNEYYIVHEDSAIAADSCFTGPMTIYGANYLIISIHNAEDDDADTADVLLKVWMKH